MYVSVTDASEADTKDETWIMDQVLQEMACRAHPHMLY